MNYAFVPFFLLLFSTIPEYGEFIQVGSVIFMVLYMLYLRNEIQISFEGNNYMFFCVFPLLSITTAIFRQDFNSINYSMVLIFCLFSISIINCKIYTIDIFKSFLLAMGLGTLIILATHSSDLILALKVTQNENGLFRFSPFGSHPNLIGHIYATTLVVSVFYAIGALKTWEKISSLILAVVSLIFIFAASSRGGLVAAIISVIASLAIHSSRFDQKTKKWLIISFSSSVLLLMILNTNNIVDFVFSILEINSDSRGTGSGMTGRTDGWPIVLNYVFLETYSYIFGNGFRSWNFEEWGFHIDNGYINLIYEVGVPATCYIVYVFINKLNLSVKTAGRTNIIITALVIFALAEGVVARYLFGIGNPASLLLIFILLSNQVEEETNEGRYLPQHPLV